MARSGHTGLKLPGVKGERLILRALRGRPGLSWFSYLPPLGRNHSASSSLSVFICKIGLVLAPASGGCCGYRMRHGDKELSMVPAIGAEML